MNMRIKCFGIARDITNSDVVHLDLGQALSVRELRKELTTQFKEFGSLRSFRIAVNQEFANEDTVVQPFDEVAIIPPVSGG